MSAGLFLSKLVDRAHDKAEQARQEQHNTNQQYIDMYKQVLANPMSTDLQRQSATDNLNKLYPQQSKGVDSPFSKILGVLNHVGGKAQASGQGAAAPINTPTSTAPNAVSSTQTLGLPTLDAAGASDASGGTGSDGGAAASAPAPSAPPPKPLPPIGPQDNGQASFDSGAAGGTAPSQPATNLTGAGADTVQAKPSLLNRIAGGAQKGLSLLTPSASSSPADAGVTLNAQDFPSPIPPALKFDSQNLVTGDSLDPTGVDRFGNPVDPTKKYALAPDPRGTMVVNGRRVTAQPFIPKPSSAAPRGLGATVSMGDAQQLEQSGQPILGPTGKKYDLSKIPANMKFQAVGIPGGGVGYVLGTEKQVNKTVGNEVYAVNEFEQADPSKYYALGAKNVGKTTSTEKPFTNSETGETTLIKTNSSQSPNTPGLQGAPRSLPTLAPNTQSNTGLPPLTPATQMNTVDRAPTGQVTTSTPRAAQTTSGTAAAGRVLPNMIPTGQAKGLRDRNTALNGTTTALENGLRPDPATGQSYLDLFKPENTPQRQKVANFIRLNDSIAEGEYDRAAGEGSIAGLASFALGIPQAVAASKNKQLQEAFDAIKNDPQAQADVAHYYNQIGQIGGMRKATGASSGQWSFNTLKQEVPNPETDGDLSIVKTKYNNLIREVKNNSGPNLKARPFDSGLANTLNAPQDKTPTFQVFHDGGHTFRIPASDVNDFKKDHPNAR